MIRDENDEDDSRSLTRSRRSMTPSPPPTRRIDAARMLLVRRRLFSSPPRLIRDENPNLADMDDDVILMEPVIECIDLTLTPDEPIQVAPQVHAGFATVFVRPLPQMQPNQMQPNQQIHRTEPPNEPNPVIYRCTICMLAFVDPVTSASCGHVFCRRCIYRSLRIRKRCPICIRVIRGQRSLRSIFLD